LASAAIPKTVYSQNGRGMETEMKLSPRTDTIWNESEVFEQLLALDGKEILELGCGKADITRLISTKGQGRKITATEVDAIQHGKNLLIDDLTNVTFVMAGSEAIPFGNESFDVVFMFKSLHHVPIELMGSAFKEIKRVLKPGGMAYISEPVLDGDFNELLRLFHDEEEVRKAAYRAIKKSTKHENLLLIDEIFFNTQVFFENFEEFENKVINVTHTKHQLSPELHQKVKDRYSLTMRGDGAKFVIPMRVDLLQKKAKS
jgi:ubiquinone/menaquinone biosynthesis C-methylase UbiE